MDTERAKRWRVGLKVGGPILVYGHKPITREQVVAYIEWTQPGAAVTSCLPQIEPAKSVWSGRNAYRDNNPDWWRWLYGGG